MTVKEIYEKTKSGELKLKLSYSIDYNINYCGEADYYLEMYKKAFRKNAAFRYREIKAFLEREAVIVEHNYCGDITYHIITRRSIEGPFSKPLDEYQKIIFE